MKLLPRFLSKEAILAVHQQQIARFGGSLGIRDEGLLESALGAAEQCWFYTDDVYQVAAQYCVSLVHNHPFVDGNKRIAAAAILLFLELNQLRLKLSSEQLYALVIDVVVGELSREQLAAYLFDALKYDI